MVAPLKTCHRRSNQYDPQQERRNCQAVIVGECGPHQPADSERSMHAGGNNSAPVRQGLGEVSLLCGLEPHCKDLAALVTAINVSHNSLRLIQLGCLSELNVAVRARSSTPNGLYDSLLFLLGGWS
jgi:hypothetical protein